MSSVYSKLKSDSSDNPKPVVFLRRFYSLTKKQKKVANTAERFESYSVTEVATCHKGPGFTEMFVIPLIWHINLPSYFGMHVLDFKIN